MDLILKGIGLGLFLSVSVGPVVFAIIKMSLKYGHKAGFALISGISASDITMVVLGNMAAELVQNLLKYKTAIAIGGAVLVIFIGCYTLFFKKDPSPEEGEVKIKEVKIKLSAADQQRLKVGDVAHIHLRNKDLFKIFAQGFFINTLNPGAIFLWLTWSTTFSYLSLVNRIILFGTTLIIVLSTDILKVLLAGAIRQKLTPKTLHNISKLTALILIGFGVAIIIGLALNKYYHH